MSFFSNLYCDFDISDLEEHGDRDEKATTDTDFPSCTINRLDLSEYLYASGVLICADLLSFESQIIFIFLIKLYVT